MRRILLGSSALVLTGGILLGGCEALPIPLTGSYTSPQIEKNENSIILKKSFDEVWAKLMRVSTETFFSISTLEKVSGVMSLDFSVEDVDQNVDCGRIQVDAVEGEHDGFIGTYIEYNTEARQLNADLTGKMNVLVQSIDSGKTKVTLNARYKLSFNGTLVDRNCRYELGNVICNPIQVPVNDVYNFGTNFEDTKKLSESAALSGSILSRTCVATGVLEERLLKRIGEA